MKQRNTLDKLIIFDLDDTLIDTSDLYWRVREEFIQFIDDSRYNKADFESIFEEMDTKNTVRFGLNPYRYELTMLEMYDLLNPGKIDGAITQKIKNMAGRILAEVPILIEGATDLLEWSKQNFTIALITRGASDIQKMKIKYYDLTKYFGEFIKIVDSKNEGVYLDFIASLGFSSNSTIIIGDSIKSEINPALKIGAVAIHYKYTHHSYHWIQEHNVRPVEKEYFEITRLADAKAVLTKYL